VGILADSSSTSQDRGPRIGPRSSQGNRKGSHAIVAAAPGWVPKGIWLRWIKQGLMPWPQPAAAALVLALLLLAAGGAAAGELGKPEPTLRLVAIYGGAELLDIGSTEYALAHGAQEGNPLFHSRALRIGTGAALVAGMTLATRELQKHDHPKLAKWLKWGFVMSRVALAVNNVRVARQR